MATILFGVFEFVVSKNMIEIKDNFRRFIAEAVFLTKFNILTCPLSEIFMLPYFEYL